MLITLEGIDGTGKSTVIERMDNEMEIPGRGIVFTAEPVIMNPVALRDSAPMAELFYFMADHAEHLKTVVMPALERGDVVISDRYVDSRVAYQGVTLRGIVPDLMGWIRKLHEPWSVVPDLTILLMLHPSVAAERCHGTEDPEFLGEVTKNYYTIVGLDPDRFVIVNAHQTKDEVYDQVLEEIQKVVAVDECI